MSGTMVPEKTPDYEEWRSAAPILGPMPVQLPGGIDVNAVQFQSLTMLMCEHAQGTFCCIVIAMPSGRDLAADLAAYIPIEADNLRALAAGMLRNANELDDGRGKQ